MNDPYYIDITDTLYPLSEDVESCNAGNESGGWVNVAVAKSESEHEPTNGGFYA
jgi:hypothetical protein